MIYTHSLWKSGVIALCFALAPGGLISAQEGNFAVYKLPDSMPGELYILADEDGTFTASYSYQPDLKDKDSTCIGVIEGEIGDWSMRGEYREVNEGMSIWGRMELAFDQEDKSCVLVWRDDAFDDYGSWTMRFLRMGDKYDTMKMELNQGLVNAYYDREETEEYLELWE